MVADGKPKPIDQVTKTNDQGPGNNINTGRTVDAGLVEKLSMTLQHAQDALTEARILHARVTEELKQPARLGDNFCRKFFPVDDEDGHYNYCVICGLGGDIMCCETEGCPNVAHPHCVGLTCIPEGNWFCEKKNANGETIGTLLKPRSPDLVTEEKLEALRKTLIGLRAARQLSRLPRKHRSGKSEDDEKAADSATKSKEGDRNEEQGSDDDDENEEANNDEDDGSSEDEDDGSSDDEDDAKDSPPSSGMRRSRRSSNRPKWFAYEQISMAHVDMYRRSTKGKQTSPKNRHTKSTRQSPGRTSKRKPDALSDKTSDPTSVHGGTKRQRGLDKKKELPAKAEQTGPAPRRSKRIRR